MANHGAGGATFKHRATERTIHQKAFRRFGNFI
jgi:hypothetical protein